MKTMFLTATSIYFSKTESYILCIGGFHVKEIKEPI